MPRWTNALKTAAEIQQLKRDAVLREAGRAFSRRGYHNTSLDDVAEALQVSKGTLYNYVKDKQEILWEFHRIASEIGQRAFDQARAKGGTGAEVLRSTLELYIHGLTQELGAFTALMEVNGLKPEDRVKAVKLRDSFEKNFLQILQAGMADGSIRAVEPRLAIFTFMGAINWLPRWYSPGGRLSGSTIAESMTDLLLRGLVTNTTIETSAPQSQKPEEKLLAPVRKRTTRAILVAPAADGIQKRRAPKGK